MLGFRGILCALLAVLSSVPFSTAILNEAYLGYYLPCSKDDLHYRAYPYDCHKYMACQDDAMVVIDCPEGFIWNQQHVECDFPENTNCTQIPFPEPDCSNGKNTYWRYPYDCSKFWECLHGVGHLLPCPADYFWDDEIKQCDVKEAVDCSGIIPNPNDTTTISPAPGSSTTDNPYTTPSMICTDTTKFFPDIYDCSKFYECANGKPVSMSCPPGELWNNDIDTCDWPANVNCSYTVPTPATNSPSTPPATSVPTGSPSSPPPTTPYPFTVPDMTCKDGATYYPDVYDCSKYYECSNGKPVSMDCPQGEFWNYIQNICDWPANVDCSYVISTTPHSSPNTPPASSTTGAPNTPSTTPYPFTIPDMSCKNGDTYYPNIYDCSKYYECSNGKPVPMDCPAGELWNYIKDICDWSANVDCSYVVSTTASPTSVHPTNPPTSSAPTTAPPTNPTTSRAPTTSSSGPGPTTPDMVCKDDNTYFPYLYDCSKFYQCANGVPVLKDCPPGQFWDDYLKTCDWPQNVDCSYVISTTASP